MMKSKSKDSERHSGYIRGHPMESPRIHGDAEEKSSCESGWTMYIEDTFNGNHHSEVVYDDDDDDDDGSGVKEVDDDGGGDNDDDDDDADDSSDDGSHDSTTSDASSWPSTQPAKNTKNHAAKQVNHQTENRARERFSDQGEESELKARTRISAASRVKSRGKVKKTK